MESKQTRKPLTVHLVSSTDSPEFTHLTRALTRSSLVSLDAEWKPTTRSDRRNPPSFPTVALLQIACADSDESSDSVVFLLDLLSIPLDSISESLRDALVSPDILKLGFRFKQDLVYLSSTFSCHGCDSGFDKVEPYMDIASVYNYLQHSQYGKRISKNIKSLATIYKEVLGISLSKELQCSDWSHRPLSDAQLEYAAMDAHCLLEIFDVFRAKVIKECMLNWKKLLKRQKVSNEFRAVCSTKISSFGSVWTAINFTGRELSTRMQFRNL